MRIELLVMLVLTSGCGIGLTPGKTCPDDCNDNDICTLDACSQEGTCVHTPTNNGNSCGNKQVCNAGSCVTCEAGVACTPPNSCLNGMALTGVTSCKTGVSECVLTSPFTSDGGSSCDDGNACTTGDTCVGDTCVAGRMSAVDDGHDCTVDSCSVDAGIQHQNKPEGTECIGANGTTSDKGHCGTSASTGFNCY